MLSELFMLMFLMIFSSQSSALWSSIITIPLSLSFIVSGSSNNVFSGLFMLMFLMIFIGGLMVLLLSVASISFQEQSYNLIKSWILLALLISWPVLFSFKEMVPSNSLLLSVSWLERQSMMYFIMITLLSISLLTMSKLIISFKGQIRSI